jgi:cytochrome P450
MARTGLAYIASLWAEIPTTTGAVRGDATTVLVVDPDIALGILADRDNRYRRNSGFYRTTSHSPIPEPQLGQLSSAVKRLLRSTAPLPSSEVAAYFDDQAKLQTQASGALFASWAFRAVLGTGRSKEFAELVSFYVDRLVIRSALRAALPSTRRRDFARARRTAGRLVAAATRSEGGATDIVDLILDLAPFADRDEVGELYLRLVLAFVGFTGTALEWMMLRVATDPRQRERPLSSEDVQRILHESQRDAPTAWRLTRVVAVAHKIARVDVAPGDTVVIPTHRLHHSPDVWPNPDDYVPDRWASAQYGPRHGYIPFGFGSGACPAGPFVSQFLTDVVSAVTASHVLSTTSRLPFTKANALSLWSPRRQALAVTPRLA